MELKDRIEAFAELGRQLLASLEESDEENNQEFSKLINQQQVKNGWFTPGNVRAAIRAITDELTHESLAKWTGMYPELTVRRQPITVGVIMAGNIPLVGFHDFLCVLITGNKVLAKTSSKDSDLIVYISKMLCSINPDFNQLISFTDNTLDRFDAIIATGSNNSSRYFESYFGKYPNIIRKNRNSIAVIDGSESDKELSLLGSDIFSYFGLGCRNVSKIYLPEKYDLKILIEKWDGFSDVMNNTKYANNYDFNKAVYLVNKEKFLDAGYILLKEEKNISSPVSVLYYEYYSSYKNILHIIDLLKDKIQCIVAKGNTPFGQAQHPSLWDYADGVDTLDFLLKKKSPGIL